MMSLIILGFSMDVDPSWMGWTVLEMIFATVFVFEVFVKLLILSPKVYFTGTNAWWNIGALPCAIFYCRHILTIFSIDHVLQSNIYFDGLYTSIPTTDMPTSSSCLLFVDVQKRRGQSRKILVCRRLLLHPGDLILTCVAVADVIITTTTSTTGSARMSMVLRGLRLSRVARLIKAAS